MKETSNDKLYALGLSAFMLAAVSCASTDAVRGEYEAGVRYFDRSEFNEALTAFANAYHARPDAAFLFNIAQCHRKLGHIDDAIASYQTFLREAPDAKNRSDVERRIAELEIQRRKAGDVAKLQQQGDVSGLIRILEMNGNEAYLPDTHDDSLVGEAAAKAISQIGRAAVPALINTLKTHPGRVSRALAAYALGRMGSAASDAVPALVACLHTETVIISPGSLLFSEVTLRVGLGAGEIAAYMVFPAGDALRRITGRDFQRTQQGAPMPMWGPWVTQWARENPKACELLTNLSSDQCGQCSSDFRKGAKSVRGALEEGKLCGGGSPP
jgi:hypothetical protein